MDPHRADGQFVVEEDARVLQAAQRLEVVPTVSNYGPAGFSRKLAQAVLATDATRKDAARRLDQRYGNPLSFSQA